ncbi:MAG: hypothetical protein ACRD1O_05425 [Terriglobia bacterium]
MTPELQALTQRLEDVEKQVAHLEALAVWRSDAEETVAARTVNARKFVVSDAHGVPRAELGMTIPAGQTEEHPWLGLFDANGNVRACLGVHGGLPWLEFYDGNQKRVVNLWVDEHGPGIGLHDGNGKAAAVIDLSKDGPLIMLHDANGKLAVSVSMWEGRPSLTLHDPSGKGQLSLQVGPSGTKKLLMVEHGGEAQPSVGPSLKLEVTSDGPCLQFGKDNKVFWSAPQGPPTGRG